jgi:hypothetical protein
MYLQNLIVINGDRYNLINNLDFSGGFSGSLTGFGDIFAFG